MKLYSYFPSSASFRVRIALNLKGLPYEFAGVHLLRGGGEQFKPEFAALNPQSLVPVLVDGDQALTQSLAIIEYLEETHPKPALLPKTPAERARVRSLALLIACDIHPLNNLRVLKYLKRTLKVEDDAKDAWYCHWVNLGFTALEARLACDSATGRFCHGDTPGLADCCLVPQVFNAQRLKCDLSAMPTIRRIHESCMGLEAFQRAAPANQPDAE